MTKHRHSREVRLIGYCIIVLEVLTVFTWGAAFYGNVGVLATAAMSATSPSSGHSISFTNTTAGAFLTVPITGRGFFPVTVTTAAQFMNSSNQVVAQVKGSVTVSPGETKNLTLLIPSSIWQSKSSIDNYNIGINIEVSSVYGLVGIKGQVAIQPGRMGGNSS